MLSSKVAKSIHGNLIVQQVRSCVNSYCNLSVNPSHLPVESAGPVSWHTRSLSLHPFEECVESEGHPSSLYICAELGSCNFDALQSRSIISV